MSAELSQEFLTPVEVKTMTGEATADGQERVLQLDGVPFKRRGNRILVSRFHTREWLSGRAVTPSRGVNLSVVK